MSSQNTPQAQKRGAAPDVLEAVEALEHAFGPAAFGALVEAVAQAVVVRVDEIRSSPPAARLLTAAELADVLGVHRDTVYEHAGELGVIRIGGGKKPRLRFDLEQARAAWTVVSTGRRSLQAVDGGAEPKAQGRPRLSLGANADLLPIKGRMVA
jgi:excisionase family DNA binding protein